MGRVLTDMDEDHRADMRLEQDLRVEAYRLEALAEGHRLAGTPLGDLCNTLAAKFRGEANHIVQVWE